MQSSSLEASTLQYVSPFISSMFFPLICHFVCMDRIYIFYRSWLWIHLPFCYLIKYEIAMSYPALTCLTALYLLIMMQKGHRNLPPVRAYISLFLNTNFSVYRHILSNTVALTFLDCGALGLLCTFYTFFHIYIWLPESHAPSNVNMGLDAECSLSVGLHLLPN